MRPEQRAVAVALEWHTWAETPKEMLPSGKTLAELVTKAIRQAVADEREACAKECESKVAEIEAHPSRERWKDGTLAEPFAIHFIEGCQDCAEAIRARGAS